MLRLVFLGTGTSSGIPVLGCDCNTCCSDDARNTRFRTSAYIITQQGTRILIDVGPDFRLQAIRHKIHRLDGILLTHSHNDHVGGLDELRQLNSIMNRNIDVYTNDKTMNDIRTRFDYIFQETQNSDWKSQLDLHLIEAQRDFFINEQKILPLEVLHGKRAILGYRMDGLAYITDASYLTPTTLKSLENTKILVINALRFRPYSSHFSIKETLTMIELIQPRAAYLVHMSHEIEHREVEKILPNNVYLAYDNLEITCC